MVSVWLDRRCFQTGSNRFKPVQTGSNRFEPVHTGLSIYMDSEY